MDSYSYRAESQFVQTDNSLDKIIFWSAEYEEQLLMDHGLGELAARLYPSNPDPAVPVETKPNDVLDWAIDGVPISFDTSMEMEMPKFVLDDDLPCPAYSGSYKASPYFGDEISMPSDVDSTGSSHPAEVKYKNVDVPAVSRRGRPSKSTSSSRMAQYSRFYREMKKSQLQESEKMVAQLREENQELRQENKRMMKGFRRMEEELFQLRSLMGSSAKSADWLI